MPDDADRTLSDGMRSAPRTAGRRHDGLHRAAIALAIALLAPAAAVAAERPIALKPGAGSDLVASRCASCHSLDYVTINAPFLSQEQWQASVTKMRNFGAPLSDDEARAIVAYLATAYGRPPG